MTIKIFVIDDDTAVTDLLSVLLNTQGFQVWATNSSSEGLTQIRENKPDLVILDLMLPQIDGREVCRILRRESDIPIIMLTALSEEIDQVTGLEIGADDYITKPFSTPELLARLRAVQRKTRPSEEVSVFKNGDLVVDLTAHVVTRAGREIKLSATEYALLRLFVKHPGRVLTHRHILREIWRPKSEEHRQYLRVYVTHLRQKIEPDPAKPSLIQTQPGIGYRFSG